MDREAFTIFNNLDGRLSYIEEYMRLREEESNSKTDLFSFKKK